MSFFEIYEPDKHGEAREYFLNIRSLKETCRRYDLRINSCRKMLLGETWSHIPNPVPREIFEEIVRRGNAKWSDDEISEVLTRRESGQSWKKIAIAMNYGSPMTPWRMYKEITNGGLPQNK